MERLLEWMELAPLGEAFDGDDFGTVRLRREHQTGTRGFAVQQDRAGAADSVLAARMRAGEPEVLAQEVDQKFSRLALPGAGLPVDREMEFQELRHRRDLSVI